MFSKQRSVRVKQKVESRRYVAHRNAVMSLCDNALVLACRYVAPSLSGCSRSDSVAKSYSCSLKLCDHILLVLSQHPAPGMPVLLQRARTSFNSCIPKIASTPLRLLNTGKASNRTSRTSRPQSFYEFATHPFVIRIFILPNISWIVYDVRINMKEDAR
jgi:hypothetical protein